MHFDLTWKEKVLDEKYGVPRDMAKLAADVHRALTESGEFVLKQFSVHGKYVLKCPPSRLKYS